MNGTAATRLGELYHRSLTASNATVPVWQEVETEDSDGDPSVTSYFWYDPQSLSPGYDEDGNLVNDGRWVYTWDAENRLIQMETTTAATTASHPYTKLVFHYDGEGRRLSRTVYRGGPTTHESTRRWLYDGWNPIVEYSATSESATSVTRLNTLTWGTDLSGSLQGAGGVGGLLAQIGVSGGEVYRASYDGNGNVVSWTKSDQATAEWRTEYDAFGNPTVTEGSSPSEHGFSTKIRDPYTGLSYYGYRYYDPVTGRWPSRDPIGEEGGTNLYGFVGNGVTNRWDFLGLDWHHLIPFTSGLDAGLSPEFINSSKNGWEMSQADHKELHSNQWLAEWNKFFREKNWRCSEKEAKKKLQEMMEDERFRDILSRGVQSNKPAPNVSGRMAGYNKSHGKMGVAGIIGTAAGAAMISTSDAKEFYDKADIYIRNDDEMALSEALVKIREIARDDIENLIFEELEAARGAYDEASRGGKNCPCE